MLSLSEGERAEMTQRVISLTDGFNALSEVDTEGVLPLVTVLPVNSVLREDTMIKNFTRDEILSNAPEQYDGYFAVPGVIE